MSPSSYTSIASWIILVLMGVAIAASDNCETKETTQKVWPAFFKFVGKNGTGISPNDTLRSNYTPLVFFRLTPENGSGVPGPWFALIVLAVLTAVGGVRLSGSERKKAETRMEGTDAGSLSGSTLVPDRG